MKKKTHNNCPRLFYFCTGRPESDCPFLTTGHKCAIRRIRDPQNGISVWNVFNFGRQMESHLLGPKIGVFFLSIFQLHVSAELIPGNGAFRWPVNFHKQRVDLSFLKWYEKNLCNNHVHANDVSILFILLLDWINIPLLRADG